VTPLKRTGPRPGRTAASPWALGGLSVRKLGKRVYERVWHDEILDRAAELSYYFAFALVPTLLFVTTLLGLLPLPDLMPQLIAYLDRRFSELKSELKSELTLDLRGEIAASAAGLKSEITLALRAEIAASAAETRRHFDVVADRLMDKIELVGEGVIGVDQKLDRFRGEVAEEFRRVDRRLLRLEARAIG